MKQELFIQLLEQYAELKVERVAIASGEQTSRLGVEVIERQGQQFELSATHNPTLNVKIKQLKPIIKSCEDCGKECQDRVVTKNLYSFPHKHWRRYCNGCQRVFNPETQQYDLTVNKAQPFFTAYLKQQDK